MSGWSISLSVPPADKRVTTIHAYFEYAEAKRAEHCSGENLSLDDKREHAIESLEQNDLFHVSVPIDPNYAEYADFEEAFAMADDWIVSGDRVDDLIELFRDAATELERSADDPGWDVWCYAEAAPIAMCEFARERGYAVHLHD